MPTEIFWYISRTAALVAYVLLFFNMFLGLEMKLRFLDKICAKWLAFDLHQFTALVGIALIRLQYFALLGDTYLYFTLPQVFGAGLFVLPGSLDGMGDYRFLCCHNNYGQFLFTQIHRAKYLAKDTLYLIGFFLYYSHSRD